MKNALIVTISFLLFFGLGKWMNAQNESSFNFTEDLLLYYPFEGDAQDASGNDNNGIIDGAILTEDRFGNLNSAYAFDGVNDFISTPGTSNLKPDFPVTITAWVYLNDYNLNNLFGNDQPSDLYYGFWVVINDGVIGANFGNGGPIGPGSRSSTRGRSILNLNEWYHIAVVFESPNIKKIFVNGKPDGVSEKAGFATSLAYSNSLGAIGTSDAQNGPGGQEYFHGKIDELRFYSRILSEQEIECLASANEDKLFIKCQDSPGPILVDSAAIVAVEDGKVGDARTIVDKNFGENKRMTVRRKPNGWAYESYVRFKLPIDNTDKDLEKATVCLYGSNPNNANIVSIGVFETKNSWTEDSITWNNSPKKVGPPLAITEVNNQLSYYEWDITELVHFLRVENRPFVDLVFVSLTETDEYDRARFYTSETDRPPLLKMQYGAIPLDCQADTLSSFKDATVTDGRAFLSRNFGGETFLFARNKPNGYSYESYITFELDRIEKPIQAKLRLYGVNPNNDHPVKVGVYSPLRTDDKWKEEEITLLNSDYPGVNTEKLLDSVIVSDSAAYYEFDVSAEIIEQWEVDKRATLAIRSLNNDTLYDRAKFSSSELFSTPPQLVVSCNSTINIFQESTFHASEQFIQGSLLSIYPNPANNLVQIEFDDPFRGELQVSIINITGQQILRKTFNKENQVFNEPISLIEFSSGVYILNVKMDDIQHTQKLIINHP